jgi:hypothetical protein
MCIITNKDTIQEIKSYFNENFGVSNDVFENYVFVRFKNKVYLLAKTKLLKKIRPKKLYGAGLLLFADFRNKIPANLGLAWFKRKYVSKNFVVLKPNQVAQLYKGTPIDLKYVVESKIKTEKGLIVVCMGQFVVASAWLDNKQLKINSGLSKS